MNRIATSLLLVTLLALGCAAQRAALSTPPTAEPPKAPETAQAQATAPAAAPAPAQAPPEAAQSAAAPAPAATGAAQPAEPAPAQAPPETQAAQQPAPAPACEAAPAAPEAKKARPVCPATPTEESYGGPYWTEQALEPRPFICPSYSYPEKTLRKLGRGLANIITAPVELINQPLNSIYRTETAGCVPSTTALLVGIPLGVGWTVYRVLAGAIDIATFPLPFYSPLIKPEFVMNDFQRRRILQIKGPEQMKRRLEGTPR